MHVVHRGFAETDVDRMLCLGRGANGFARFEIIGRHKNGEIMDCPQGREIVQ